jgi:hypothetical protein
MPFIGNKPTAIPLSADDLEDNIISTAKIQDNAVTPAKYIEPVPFRNIIINGDMSIAQRSTSVAGITSAGYYTVDRFQIFNNTLGTWTQSQDTDVPSGQGFAKSLKMDCTTADASPSANDYLWFEQRIEGQNLQYLKKGTSSAESLTLSFWVKSNKTGTYIAELRDSDNTRQISKSYTISASNTWEKKTITYTGDTTGAFTNDNGLSLTLILWLGAGSNLTSGTLNTSWNATTTANRAVGQVNLADSTSNEWYITGVQLEAGTSASDFEFLPHDVNLQRCQRYYQNIVSGNNEPVCFGFYNGASSLVVTIPFQTSMRTDPTLDSNIESTLTVDRNGGNETITSLTLNRSDKSKASLYNNSVSSTSGVGAKVRTDSSGDSISFDAEL